MRNNDSHSLVFKPRTVRPSLLKFWFRSPRPRSIKEQSAKAVHEARQDAGGLQMSAWVELVATNRRDSPEGRASERLANLKLLRGRAVRVARQAHNLEVVGSNPTPAIYGLDIRDGGEVIAGYCAGYKSQSRALCGVLSKHIVTKTNGYPARPFILKSKLLLKG